MADYIYLLENRLSQPQKNALNAVREIAREKGLTVFLVGGAVRDLTSGSPVRDLDVVVQGNAPKLKKDIEKTGGILIGEHEPLQSLFVRFPGGAEVEIGSALTVTYSKPGKPVAHAATILDDLRRRDFTANAMALSLNTGSYGLLMDPLNGVADIENRELRLVSNYGFIEDPIRMIRAVRLSARLGWQMDEKTQTRYSAGKEEGYISAASVFQRGYEVEEIVREEDPLRVMRGLEAEGWMAVLTPNWNSSKANVAELEHLRETQTQLQMLGIHPNPAAANFPLLTAKLSAKEASDLKASFARPGFVREIEALDAETREFATQFTSKAAALPSQSWKLLYSAKPEAVLMVAHSSKSPAIQAKFKSFYSEWPQARQKVPYSLLQEMRITPELSDYEKLVDSLVFELMDGKLGTPEEMKTFLEPYSPPAPPPPVHLRRPRTAKKEAKAGKGRGKKSAPPVEKEAAAETGNETKADRTVFVSPIEESAPESLASPAKPVKVVAESASPKPDTIKPDATKPAKAKAEAAKPEPAKAAAKKIPAAPKKLPTPAMIPIAVKKSSVAKKQLPVKNAAAKTPAKKPQVKTATKSSSKAVFKSAAGNKGSVKKVPAKAFVRAATKKVTAKTPVKAVSKKVAVKASIKTATKKAVSKAPAKKRR